MKCSIPIQSTSQKNVVIHYKKEKKTHNFNFVARSRFHFPSNKINVKKGSSYDVGWRHILFRNQFFYYTSKNKTGVKLAMFSTIKMY